MVTVAKAALDIGIPDKVFLVCTFEVQQSLASCWLLEHLCHGVVIKKTLQKHPGYCSWDGRVPYEDQSL